MRLIRCLVVVGALIGALLPTVALAQQPDTPKSEAVIEGRWKFTFTRTAVHEQWFDAPRRCHRSATRLSSPRWSRPGSKHQSGRTSSRCPATVTAVHAHLGSRLLLDPERAQLVGPASPSATGGEPPSCQPRLDTTERSRRSPDDAPGQQGDRDRGRAGGDGARGTRAPSRTRVWHWWTDEDPTRREAHVYAQISEVTVVAGGSMLLLRCRQPRPRRARQPRARQPRARPRRPHSPRPPRCRRLRLRPRWRRWRSHRQVAVVARRRRLVVGVLRLLRRGFPRWPLLCGVLRRCRGRFQWWRPTPCWPCCWCC